MYQYPDYMYHHGVKGMKWGVRRYQNSNGSLTSAGKKRYDRDVRENNAKVKDKRIKIDGPDAQRWVKEDITRAKKTVDAASDLNRQLSNLNRSVPTKTKRNSEKIDLSKMSDQELRDKINRANLERQYNDLYNPATVSEGRKRVSEILEYGGTALGVASSALGIALAIKGLKG